jgi:hypothetical protein
MRASGDFLMSSPGQYFGGEAMVVSGDAIRSCATWATNEVNHRAGPANTVYQAFSRCGGPKPHGPCGEGFKKFSQQFACRLVG